MSEEKDYQCIEPFFIDDGELDGIPPNEVFTLGVEWQMVYAEIQTGEPFERPIHGKNATRLQTLLIRNKRRFTMESVEGDWRYLKVKGLLESDDE